MSATHRGTTTRFVYDGTQLVGEYNTSGNAVVRYVYAGGVDDPVVWYEGTGLTDKR